MHAVGPSSRASRTAKAAAQAGAILAKLDKESLDRVLTVLVMAKCNHRGLTLENLAARKRLPPDRFIYGECE
jgi:hypothetical protein